MTNINKVLLSGSVKKVGELRKGQSGTSYLEVLIDSTRAYTNWKTGEVGFFTDTVPLMLFGKRAEQAKNDLQRGALVQVEGYLSARKNTSNGTDYYNITINAESLMVVGMDPASRNATATDQDNLPFD